MKTEGAFFCVMNTETQAALILANQAIIQYRGTYSRWAALHNLNYHEMLVLYTIRDAGFCTQKQLCDSFLLPRQTIHNVIQRMRSAGLLEVSPALSGGREKAFVLTPAGTEYADVPLRLLSAVEERAVALMGHEKLTAMANLVLEFDCALNRAMAAEETQKTEESQS